MGLAAFNRMRREAAEREVKAKQEAEKPIEKMTIKELKEELLKHGIQAEESAKKADLVALLESVSNPDSQDNPDPEAQQDDQEQDQPKEDQPKE